MLGGYYLGQAYLGISGWTASGTLTVQDTTHGHTVGNIALVQQHTIVVSNTTHSLTSDIIDLIEHKTLALDSTSHSLVSDVIALVQQHTLVIANTLHGLTSDNITLLQFHTLAVANTAHSLATDGNLLLNQYLLLNQPDPGVFLVTSPQIVLVQHHTLVIDNTMHELINSIARVVNWADYNLFSGIFIKDFGSEGIVEQIEKDSGVVIVDRTQNVDTLVPVTQDTGTFITEFSAFGRYK